MATPVLSNNNTNSFSTASSVAVTLSGNNSHKCIWMAIDNDVTGSLNTPSGWGKLAFTDTNATGVLYYTTATNSSSSVTISWTGNENGVYTSWDTDTDPSNVENATQVTFSNTAPNSGSLTYSGGSGNHLFITAFYGDDGRRGVVQTSPSSGWPTNYTLYQTNLNDGSPQGSNLGWAARAVTAATEDPGAWTLTGNTNGAAVTFVFPEGGATSYNDDVSVTTDLTTTSTDLQDYADDVSNLFDLTTTLTDLQDYAESVATLFDLTTTLSDLQK